MATSFEHEKNRKAFIYTVIICVSLLLMFILISWKNVPPTEPVVQDLIEIDLGNDDGFGPEQPLIKGNRTPETSVSKPTVNSGAIESATQPVNADENAEATAAPVERKTERKNINRPITPSNKTAEKPQQPKVRYPGQQPGPPGNNDSEDNDYRSHGKDKTKNQDNGIPEGTKGGGPVVTSGNRKIIYRSYNFTGDLAKATIYAQVKVSANGEGTLVKLVKPSTSFSRGYANAVSDYLRNMQFNKSTQESVVVVQFNFNVK